MACVLVAFVSVVHGEEKSGSDERVYEQRFEQSPGNWDKKCGENEVKWCQDYKERNSKSGTETKPPKGSLVVRPRSEVGPCLWYHFGQQVPVSLHVELNYFNQRGYVNDGHTFSATNGKCDFRSSDQEKFDCSAVDFSGSVDLTPNTDFGVYEWASKSFDIKVPTDSKGIYLRFGKVEPKSGEKIMMLIDDLVITPVFPDEKPKKAETQPQK